MFKFGFLVFVIACAIQYTFVVSIPVNSHSEPLSKELEIVGQAAVSVLKAAGEFAESVVSTIKDHASFGLSKTALSMVLKLHVVGLAADPSMFKSKKTSDELSNEELKEYHVTAKSVIQLREKLDKMEKAEEVLNRVIDETAKHILTNKLSDFHKQCLRLLYKALDKSFQTESTLRDAYTSLREKNQKEFKAPSVYGHYDSFDDIPEQAKQKFVRAILNKLFLHHIDNRVTVYKDEYFVLARSIVELAKGEKFETVQDIYQKTLSEVTPKVDLRQFEAFDAADNLFGKLKENFKKHPTLDTELQRLQKDVSQRKEWNKSVWDLDIFVL